ncbi:MAG: thiamine phosphate synthase [Caldimicrobium sp.]|nr:thiamine phosphate synthase [Caldimicrobium sp.]MCX7613683.1 thiamine phosphate synthase [Caldimicrobium sp.]MDW8183135.1 thiamine phosphate synthase [Caldimicrobium sp.]
MATFRGLYVITDEKLTPYQEDKILHMVSLALKGGAKIVQLRDKSKGDEELVEVALKLKKLCHSFGALFIINDRVKLAKITNADGVHIGREDFPLEEALAELPGKIVGVSCYGDLARALKAQETGASYVAFGSFFPSPTKPGSQIIPKDILRKAKDLLKIPLCAIGGITLERAGELIKLGADMLAVISDIWLSPDIERRAREYQALFQKFNSL